MAAPGDSGALARRGENYIRTRSTGQEQGIAAAGRGLARGIQSAVAGGMEAFQRQREFQEKMKDRSYERALSDARLQEMSIKLDMLRNLQDVKMREAQASLMHTQARAAQAQFEKEHMEEDRELDRMERFSRLPPWQEGRGPTATYWERDAFGNPRELTIDEFEWKRSQTMGGRRSAGRGLSPSQSELARVMGMAGGAGGQAALPQTDRDVAGPGAGAAGATAAGPAGPGLPPVDERVIKNKYGEIRADVSKLVPAVLKAMPEVEKDVQSRLKNQGTMDDYKNKIARTVAEYMVVREAKGLSEMPLEEMVKLILMAEEKSKSGVDEGYPPPPQEKASDEVPGLLWETEVMPSRQRR